MNPLKIAAIATSAIVLSACSAHVQTSSGADYLSRYSSDPAYAAASTDIDADIRAIAAIEPNLVFPARIGLARLEHGRLTGIPGDEGEIWAAAAAELGPDYGTFVPVSPLIAATVAAPAANGMSGPASVIANIRRGAARQHLDYVMVYEVGSTTRDKANALALADLTIIGMFVLPSRTIDIDASASGLLLDVRNGYPYATLTAHAEKSGISRAVSGWSTSLDMADTAEERAVANLAGEFEAAMSELSARTGAAIRPTTKNATQIALERED